MYPSYHAGLTAQIPYRICATEPFKGPIEPVERTNAQGRTYTEDKIVYFKNNSAADSSDAEGSEYGEQAEDGADAPAADTAATGASAAASTYDYDDEIPF